MAYGEPQSMESLWRLQDRWRTEHPYEEPRWVMSAGTGERIKADLGCQCPARGGPARFHQQGCIAREPGAIWRMLGLSVRYDEDVAGVRLEAAPGFAMIVLKRQAAAGG